MLGINFTQASTILGLVLSLGLKLSITDQLKRVLFLSSSILLVNSSGFSLPWLIIIILMVTYLSLMKMENCFNNFIFVLIVCLGNWAQPGLAEVLLVGLSMLLNLKFEDKMAKYVLPVFAVMLLMYLINASAIVFSPFISFALLISVALLFVSIFTKKINIEDSFSMLSLFLISSQLKIIVEQNISQLNLSMYNTWIGFNLCVIFYVLLKALVHSKNNPNNKEDFVKLLALSFYLPTLNGQSIVSINEQAIYSMLIISGAILYRYLGASNKVDTAIAIILSCILIAIQTHFIIGLDFQGPTLFVVLIVLASQFFYLIKTIEYREYQIGPIYYRERLPQIGFITIIFGWICTLWYILYYVRKIQG